MSYHIKVTPRGVEVDFEVGSLSEAVGVLTDNENTLTQIMAIQVGPASTEATAIADATKSTRGRRSNKDKANEAPAPVAAPAGATEVAPAPAPAPVTATAPAPIAVPAAPPAAPAAPAGTDGVAIPDFLKRDENNQTPATAAAPAAPPAPPAPPPLPEAPPVAPVAPPAGVLAQKVVDELKRRASGAADKGAALADWCAKSGLVVAGATFDEACSVIAFSDDVKLGPVAKALGVG